VIFPNVRIAVLSGAFLTFAIVISEFTIASLLDRPGWAVSAADQRQPRLRAKSALASSLRRHLGLHRAGQVFGRSAHVAAYMKSSRCDSSRSKACRGLRLRRPAFRPRGRTRRFVSSSASGCGKTTTLRMVAG
jgi:hypothetical protein